MDKSQHRRRTSSVPRPKAPLSVGCPERVSDCGVSVQLRWGRRSNFHHLGCPCRVRIVHSFSSCLDNHDLFLDPEKILALVHLRLRVGRQIVLGGADQRELQPPRRLGWAPIWRPGPGDASTVTVRATVGLERSSSADWSTAISLMPAWMSLVNSRVPPASVTFDPVQYTSTRSPGRRKPDTPDATSTRSAKARMPGGQFRTDAGIFTRFGDLDGQDRLVLPPWPAGPCGAPIRDRKAVPQVRCKRLRARTESTGHNTLRTSSLVSLSP